ncbi:hypothetical protein GCM10027063_15240 [Promicromonospora xylanilytica]
MIENPRPTRHLEHIEPSRVGTPIPGSAQAWAAATAGDAETHDDRRAEAEPGSVRADGIGQGTEPDPPRSRLRAVVAGGVTLAVVALGAGGAFALRGDRPDDVGGPTVVGALELPVAAPGSQSSDDASGPDQRVADARDRLADAVEDGEAVHAEAVTRGAAPSALRDLRRALDAGRAALEARPPSAGAPPSRTSAYLEDLDARRSAILDAAADVTGHGQAPQDPAVPRSQWGSGAEGTGTAGSSSDGGGASEGGAGTGAPDGGGTGGGGSDGGTGGTGGPGTPGGGTTTPSPAEPTPSAEPSASAEPTPEPSSDPTPDPSVSPTATPGPTGSPSAI